MRALLRSGAALAALLIGLSSIASAQVALGDSAWAAGNFHLARIAYQRALAENPRSARANHRIGILLSWDGKLDSALVMVHRARVAVPAEPAFQDTQAQILSWAGHLPQALALYDSVLAVHPDDHPALLGRAQTLGWSEKLLAADTAFERLIAQDPNDLPARNAQAQVSAARGDYDLAIQRYQATLKLAPANAEALTGLAQTRFWMNQPREARRQVAAALSVDSTYQPARALRANIDHALASWLELTVGWSHDSDENTDWWQTASVNFPLAESVRGVVTVGLQEVSAPDGHGTRPLTEAGAVWSQGSTSLGATLGIRSLMPSGGSSHTVATGRVFGRERMSPGAALGATVYWEPFDATLALLRDPVSVFGVDLDADLKPGRKLSLGLGGGTAWTNDGNHRWSAVAVLMRQLGSDLSVGGAGRILSYDHRAAHYFSPELYWYLEGRGAWTHRFSAVWEVRLAAGLGVQQIDGGSALQSQWHAEGRLARRFGAINEVALSAGLSNSASSSTTGAYRYYTIQLAARLGL
ncbi:MAG: tetratricopeptide repeat protein [Gemmatimonadota bacterium]